MATRKKKVDFDDEDAVLADVAKALDIDPDELSIGEARGQSSFGVATVYEITTRGGRKEWQVVENEDAERDLAIAIVKQDLDRRHRRRRRRRGGGRHGRRGALPVVLRRQLVHDARGPGLLEGQLMARNRHKDLEFAVDDANGEERIFKDFDEAAGFAVSIAATGREDVYIDVLAWSRGAAKAWGGDDAAEQYDEDPEASVFERIEIKADILGRVP